MINWHPTGAKLSVLLSNCQRASLVYTTYLLGTTLFFTIKPYLPYLYLWNHLTSSISIHKGFWVWVRLRHVRWSLDPRGWSLALMMGCLVTINLNIQWADFQAGGLALACIWLTDFQAMDQVSQCEKSRSTIYLCKAYWAICLQSITHTHTHTHTHKHTHSKSDMFAVYCCSQ